ncbi:hypothetical protein LTR02_010577 [Friedmanniomyces endolithicus]|nr:hypothetical protein LTR03_015888 [Friedmanniomyces endolithicus]KAK0855943.1 hypothetical protein LTS02_010875 [Friedmanniomyces endolithicus]KAK0897714.1 hypothetical protein LTR02_010577 [Friedmanniomyces endolithicus]KAK1034168.1 hypothetical protein LTS16_015630 [Friedmanniomyces endolithicus]
MVQVIADMFFLHERGFWVGLYFTFYFSGAFLGPVMSGNIAAMHGWRSFFWLSVALALFVTLLLVVGFPETRWRRNPSNHNGSNRRSNHADEHDTKLESEIHTEMAAGGQMVGKGKPSKSQWSPFQKPDSRWMTFVVRDVTTPFIVFFNPIVFWAALMLAGPANLLLVFNLTESGLFGSPAYSFSPGAVGNTNFAFFVGGIIGVLTAGPLSDWWARRATIKNNGIREAEMRLPALLHLRVRVLWARCHVDPDDCYCIMVVATVLKNGLGFCLSYWVFNVDAQRGWVAVYMTQFAVDMFPVVMTIPLYFFGKSLRRWTRNSDLHRMEALI